MSNEVDNSRLKHVGSRIRALRETRRLNLHELARLCGISASALSLIETGKRDLRITSLIRIAEALRTTAGRILDGDEDVSRKTRENSEEGYDLGDYT
jgi:HTH-type transcriptional regulator, competence development regulator